MLEDLKRQVYEANMLLPKYGLVTFTWGNVSGIDREAGLIVIKPSGVEYDEMREEDMVVVDLRTAAVVEGRLKPSSDTDTHLELYRSMENIGGVTHTHSRWATAWAQAGRPLPPLGTTHADYMLGEVPCTRALTKQEIKSDYELNTGKVILEAFRGLTPEYVGAVLVRSHGPFTWGKDPKDSVHCAVVLEDVCMTGAVTAMLAGGAPEAMPEALMAKHFFRKHGESAYYGQG